MAETKAPDKIVKVQNTSKSVINSQQLKIMPGQTVEIPESKISEGLKRLLAIPNSGLKRLE